MKKSRLLGAFMLLCASSTANAVVILINNAGTDALGGSGYEGHSFTTPSGNSYDTLTFSWISSDQSTRLAAGNLFLLTQEYLSSPDGLSSLTSGFVAESTGIDSNAYVFDAAITLDPLTQYWVYMGSDTSLAGGGFTQANLFPGGQAYEQFGSASGDYSNIDAELDFNFILEGEISNVPVPAAVWLFGSGLLGLVGIARRKKA